MYVHRLLSIGEVLSLLARKVKFLLPPWLKEELMKLNGRLVVIAMSLFVSALVPSSLPAQTQEEERVTPIKPPARLLPDETASDGVTKYSFIAYGDTRGRRDGIAIQYEHSLIVDSMLGQIKKLENTEYPVRFVLQSGDAVVHGQNAKEWNVSFVPLINRLTLEGGISYFLAPGNHDVSSNNCGRSKAKDSAEELLRCSLGVDSSRWLSTSAIRLSNLFVCLWQYVRDRI
jgi:calcineurin-like phosphoesterase family protein